MEEELDSSPSCVTCGGITDGCKCEECGSEGNEGDCGCDCGPDSCRPRCTGCSEPDSKCTCEES